MLNYENVKLRNEKYSQAIQVLSSEIETLKVQPDQIEKISYLESVKDELSNKIIDFPKWELLDVVKGIAAEFEQEFPEVVKDWISYDFGVLIFLKEEILKAYPYVEKIIEALYPGTLPCVHVLENFKKDNISEIHKGKVIHITNSQIAEPTLLLERNLR